MADCTNQLQELTAEELTQVQGGARENFETYLTLKLEDSMLSGADDVYVDGKIITGQNFHSY